MFQLTHVLCALAVAGGGGGNSILITEVMYNPASPEDAWEWIEIVNTGPAIDFARSPWVIDDSNGSVHTEPNMAQGQVAAGGVAVLFNVDDLTLDEFVGAWGPAVDAIPVTNWSAMQLNNGGDTIGIWSSWDDYQGDAQDHLNAIVSLTFTDDAPFPADDNSASIHFPAPFGNPGDGADWDLSVVADGAWPSVVTDTNSGLDVGSPGIVLEESGCFGDCGQPDGRVDVEDLLVMLGAWGEGAGPCDLSRDGTVDIVDLLALIDHWGPCP